jgi:hypothetical protein
MTTEKTAGRPRKEVTVTDMILKLKEVKVIAGQIAQQNPVRKMRMRGITRIIDHWINVTLKRLENDPVKD